LTFKASLSESSFSEALLAISSIKAKESLNFCLDITASEAVGPIPLDLELILVTSTKLLKDCASLNI
jgi:hypothetical protein